MPIPLHEVLARVQAAARLRKDLGRERMIECCLRCEMQVCDTSSSRCLARQMKCEQRRAFYTRTAEKRRAEARAYYHANRERFRERSKAYQKDPITLAISAAKKREKYAAMRAAQGRTVRSYSGKHTAQRSA